MHSSFMWWILESHETMKLLIFAMKIQEVCGNRTEYCDLCHKYVRLRERSNHDIQFHSSPGDTAEPPR